MHLLEKEDCQCFVTKNDYEECLGIYSQGDDVKAFMDNNINANISSFFRVLGSRAIE